MSDERLSVDMHNPQQAHPEMLRVWRWCKATMVAGHRVTLEARKSTRSTDQNKMLWSILTDLSEQLPWPVDGVRAKLTPEEFKDVLTAGLRKEQRVAAGIDGGWVMLGQRTSKMTKAELSDLMELAWTFGARHDIKWSPTSVGRDGQPAPARRREEQGEPA